MPPKLTSRNTTSRPTRIATRSKTQTSTSPDELAATLATKLTLVDTKRKSKAISLSSEEQRNKAMREVNSASKSLSIAVDSGWRKSQTKKTSQPSSSTLAKAFSDASKSLKILREMTPGDVDVERAASSLVGKLIALELVRVGELHISYTYLITRTSMILHSKLYPICEIH